MNARLAVAFLSVLTSTGCIIVGSGGGTGGGGGGIAKSGDVSFSWTFGGKTCAQNSQIANVILTIPGETLNKNGVYTCLDSTSHPGVTLFDFAPGSYTYS